MDEATFWESLEFRLSREFAAQSERCYQFYWCDGIVPRDYLLNGSSPRITGRCWIFNGRRQDDWTFDLLLRAPVGSREEIDWAALHPADNATGWLTIDEARRSIEIEFARAVYDPE